MSNRFLDLIAERNRRIQEADAHLPVQEVCERIGRLVAGMAEFWSNCFGWAPQSAAELFATARLDRIASLAASLSRWAEKDELPEGDLILAWTNLGSVLEGVLKIFLCAYVTDYRADGVTRQTRAYRVKQDVLQDPDGLTLDVILKYVKLAGLLPAEEIAFGELVQVRRNAIHAFRDRELGTTADFQDALRFFRTVAIGLHYRLPYPDEFQLLGPI